MSSLLQAEHITVKFREFTAVDDVSFTLRTGEWLMLLGPNGAGKSTLLRAVSRAVPFEGRVTIRGMDTARFSSRSLARIMGVLSQTHHTEYAYRVEQVVALGRYAHEEGFLRRADPRGREAVEEALRLTDLLDKRDAPVTTLSGGEMQRVCLAQVFAQSPDILLLDEPASHLDLKYQQQLFDLTSGWLKQGDRAVMAVMHDLPLASLYGSRALVMHHGKLIAEGPVKDMIQSPEINRAYDTDVAAWLKRTQGALQPL